MGKNIVEKILAGHLVSGTLKPGEESEEESTSEEEKEKEAVRDKIGGGKEYRKW